MTEEKKNQEVDSEDQKRNEQAGLPSNGDEKPADIKSLQETIVAQTNLLLSLNKRLEAMEQHQDQTDTAIIEVAKKVGSSPGGGLLAQILPLLRQSGPGPLETIAMKMFLRNIAFSTLTTERLAKSQFGEEYEKMVKQMEDDLSGGKSE